MFCMSQMCIRGPHVIGGFISGHILPAFVFLIKLVLTRFGFSAETRARKGNSPGGVYFCFPLVFLSVLDRGAQQPDWLPVCQRGR